MKNLIEKKRQPQQVPLGGASSRRDLADLYPLIEFIVSSTALNGYRCIAYVRSGSGGMHQLEDIVKQVADYNFLDLQDAVFYASNDFCITTEQCSQAISYYIHSKLL